MTINKVHIVGNLTRDPEERTTPSGIAVVSFGVAVNERRKNAQTGEWGDEPHFFDVTMFGNSGTYAASRISKGSKVAVEGRLRYSSWEKDGQKRSKVDIVCENIEFLNTQQRRGETEFVEDNYYDTDIPF